MPSRTPRLPRPRRAASRRRGAGRPALLLAAALAAAAGLPPSTGEAQQATGVVTGVVTDAVRGQPVGMARVTLPTLERSTVADGQGRFRFEDVPPGTHRLEVEFLGYRATFEEVTVRAGETRRVKAMVAPRPVRVEDLEVLAYSLSWYPGFRERRDERTGHFFTREEIARRDPEHLTELLRGAEGVHIGFNRSAPSGSKLTPQFYQRGTRRGLFCRPAIFVDGDVTGPGQPWWYFDEIPAEEVLALEVYYRPQDVPESIDYRGLWALSGTGSDLPAWAPSRPRPGLAGGAGLGAGAGQAGSSAADVLAAAGLADGFDRELPERDDELRHTVVAGLYERAPQLEHCGAIFVWTRFYPERGG